MSNYQQTEGQSTKWRRCDRVEITNPLGGNPVIVFHEQDVVRIGNSTPFTSRVTGIPQPFAAFDMSGVINLYNPETLQPTGETISHVQLYTILFSAYLESALQRDAFQPVTDTTPNGT